MVKTKFKHFLYRYILPYSGLFFTRLLCSTYRIKIIGLEKEQAILNTGKKVVYASWHQRFFPGITFFSSRKPIAIIISKSLDGEMAARACEILGWSPVRGSSSRGGKQALEEVKKLARSEYKIGHIVDGPRGPFGIVKPGLIKIAQAAELPVLPTITSAQHKWVFNSWDRFMLPKPFSRVIIRFGDAIYIPAQMDKDEFEETRLLVEKRLKTVYDDTDRIWENQETIRQIYK